MDLNEFISHLKHNSIFLNIFENTKIQFIGTVGEFKTTVLKCIIGKWEIIKIEPIPFNTFNIFIKEN